MFSLSLTAHKLLVAEGSIVSKGKEKAGVFNAFFPSAFYRKTGYPQSNQPLSWQRGTGSRAASCSSQGPAELLRHKSMGVNGIVPRIQRELVEELTKPISIICHQSWLTREIPDDSGLAIVTPG